MKQKHYYSRSNAKDTAAEMAAEMKTISCNYCKKDGHKIRDCLVLQLKEERKEKWLQDAAANRKQKSELDFPPLVPDHFKKTDISLDYKKIVISSLTENEKKKIDQQHEAALVKQHKEAREEEIQKHLAYLEREERRKEKTERLEKEKEERKINFIHRMEEKYGRRWFILEFIDKDEDKLNQEEEEWRRDCDADYEETCRIRNENEEYEILDHLQKESEERERLEEIEREKYIQSHKESMTPAKFHNWFCEFLYQEEIHLMDAVDDWQNEGFCERSVALYHYERYAPARYVEDMTGVPKDYTDKPLEREEKQQKKDKENKMK